MMEKFPVTLHGYLSDYPPFYSKKDELKALADVHPLYKTEDGWECFTDGVIEYRRRVFDVASDLYQIDNQWINVSEETVDIYPFFRPHSMDRFLSLEIPLKDGTALVPSDLKYGVFPDFPEASSLRYPAMTVSSTATQTMGVFAEKEEATGFVTTDWEGAAQHWILFPNREMKPKDSFEATTYISLTAPSFGRPGAEAMYRIAEKVLKK